jgi:hypothetical protein
MGGGERQFSPLRNGEQLNGAPLSCRLDRRRSVVGELRLEIIFILYDD